MRTTDAQHYTFSASVTLSIIKDQHLSCCASMLLSITDSQHKI
jgi:hypothetical protein